MKILNLETGQEYIFVISTWASPQSTDYTFDIEELPCSPVTNLAVNSLTNDSASFSWSSAAGETGGYEYILMLEGEDPEVDDSVQQGTTNPAETSLSLSGLSGNQTYDLYLSTACDGETSDYVEISFTTDCNVASVNYEENFEDFLNPCWQEATGTAAGPDTFGSSGWIGVASPQTGSNAARYNMYDDTEAHWLISQSIDLGAGSPDHVLNFDIAATIWSSTEETTFSEDDEVGIMISTDDGTTWTELMSFSDGSTPSNTVQNESVDLSAYSGVVQFGIYAISSSDTSSDHWLYFDNFFVGTPSNCLPVENISVSEITTDGAEISWDAQPNAVEYTWMVFAEGADPEADTEVAIGTTSDTTASTDILESGTSYFVVIQTDCGVDGQSSLSVAVEFVTTPDFCAGDLFYDNGGPNGDYTNNANETTTIFPDNEGDIVSVTFNSFNTEQNYDGILIYDGPDTSSPLIDSGFVNPGFGPLADGTWTGDSTQDFTAEGETFVSTHPTGALTFVFTSDSSAVRAGWEATVVCGAAPDPVFANVQIIHNSPDPAAASVDVYLDGQLLPALTGVDFRTASEFLLAPAGVDFVVDVVPAGADLSQSVHTETFNLMEDENYIIVANGVLDTDAFISDNAFELAVYAGAQTVAADPTQVDVLVHHGSPDAPAVDVNETNAGNLVSNIAYPEFDGYLNLAVADYTIEIAAAGDPNALVAYSAPLATLGGFEGAAITIVASGFFGDDAGMDNGFGLWVATAAGGPLLELPEATISTIDFDSANFTYYPNPVKTSLTIEAQNNVEQVEVFNVLGQRVITQRPNQTNPRLDMNTLESGVYLMKVSINGANKTFQIIKE